MGRVKVPFSYILDQLLERGITTRSKRWVTFDTKRIYDRTDGKFVGIGWRVWNASKYATKKFDILILDE